jgi:hypothetical protein
MKASREVYSEIVKKAGAFPFPLRMLQNETRAKLAWVDFISNTFHLGFLSPSLSLFRFLY